MELFLAVMSIFVMVLWFAFGAFMFFTTVRDDIRREKERKERDK